MFKRNKGDDFVELSAKVLEDAIRDRLDALLAKHSHGTSHTARKLVDSNELLHFAERYFQDGQHFAKSLENTILSAAHAGLKPKDAAILLTTEVYMKNIMGRDGGHSDAKGFNSASSLVGISPPHIRVIKHEQEILSPK